MTHLDGCMEQSDDLSRLPALLEELREATDEHGDVAVGDESGWTLTALASGRVCWENIETGDDPRHLDALAHEDVLNLLELTASGELEAVESWAWLPGYGG